jgi:hypothetical protein
MGSVFIRETASSRRAYLPFTMLATDLQTLLDQMPAAGQAVLVALLVLGLLIWSFGRKLIKPLCVLLGLFAGAAAGLAAAHALDSSLLIVWSAVGSVIGGVLAWLLFRLWMGGALAIVLALALPAAVVVIMGASAPAGQTDVKEQFLEFRRDVEEDRSPGVQARLAAIYEQQRDEAAAWWKSLGSAGRKRAAGCVLGGALVGFLLGLIRPKFAAALMASLLGSVMIVLAGERLLAVDAPDFYASLPVGPRVTLAAVGLITILGLGPQWTFSKRKADK